MENESIHESIKKEVDKFGFISDESDNELSDSDK